MYFTEIFCVILLYYVILTEILCVHILQVLINFVVYVMGIVNVFLNIFSKCILYGVQLFNIYCVTVQERCCVHSGDTTCIV